jgi:hypothetical protein
MHPIPKPGDVGYTDLLDEDKPLAGQKYACMSFVSPEKIIAHKDIFFFDEFVKQWELSKSMEKFNQFLAFISHKYNLPLDDLSVDLQEYAKEEKDSLFKDSLTLSDEYKTFIDNNESKLQGMYDEKNNFVTSTRGVKVRGCFPSQQEAELRAKMLREIDTTHDIMVGPVGIWLPFDPDAYKTGRTEYLEAELNQLMLEKKKNESKAATEFSQRIQEAKEKAIKDNIEKAKTSGNKLSQTLDKAGNLVSVNDVTAFAGGLSEKDGLTSTEIQDKLFNSNNVVSAGGEKTVIDIGGEPEEEKRHEGDNACKTKVSESTDECEGKEAASGDECEGKEAASGAAVVAGEDKC